MGFELLGIDGQIIMYAEFGSHLYGTAGPDSDRDFKGVYMPSPQAILTGQISKSYSSSSKQTSQEGVKNTSEDTDIEIYSLHYFIELLIKGETVAMDMIHIRPDQCVISTPAWGYLHSIRRDAYSRNMSAFVGYARKQAAKYGIKGSRLDAVKQVIDFLKGAVSSPDTVRLGAVFDDLPSGEHIHIIGGEGDYPRMYQVVGKKFQESATVGYVLGILEKVQQAYGERARLAQENAGIDWKAVSHALRAAIQMEMILSGQELKFPLPQADFIASVKRGELDYTREVAPQLESYMDSVEWLASNSFLPEKTDRRYWMGVLESLVLKYIF